MKTSFLAENHELPLVVQPESGGESNQDSLQRWLVNEREWIDEQLLQHGALLMRGFAVDTSEAFEKTCRAIDHGLLNYAGGDSPRTAVTGKVYTSTEYPAELEIPLHNELSYRTLWPRKLFFCSLMPAEEGGATNLADCRRILAGIDPEIIQRFEEKQVSYIQNLHDGWGFGKSWQETFETDDRDRVEEICDQLDIEFRWSDKGLWTRSICPGVIAHPQTGEKCWFNQADLWHVSSRGREQQEKLLKIFGEDELPSNATYGDGTPISNGELDNIRSAYRTTEVVYPWQKGDFLIIDNVLVAHGRKPFTGERRTLVAMAA